MVLFGAVPYLGNFIYGEHFVPSEGPTLMPQRYWVWLNIPKFLWLVFAAPFSARSDAVWAPWDHAYWMWSRYDPTQSSFGIPITLLMVLAPICAWRLRPPVANRERYIVALPLLGVSIMILLVDYRPEVVMLGAVRFLAFVPVLIVGWTLVPICQKLQTLRVGPIAILLIGTGTFALFGQQAVDNALHDLYAPFAYVSACAKHPGTRSLQLGQDSAEYVLDELAGPTDHVAIHGDPNALIYLAYGNRQERRVSFLDDFSPAEIADDIKWVAVDRRSNVTWGAVRTSRDLPSQLGAGQPSELDMRIIRLMLSNPRFQPEYLNAPMVQAVFRRRDPMPSPH
jgi:hypothetical protein